MDRDDLSMIVEGLERILLGAPPGGSDLWATVSRNGYPKLCASEEHGGFGGDLCDATALASLAARNAAGLPLGDTILAVGLLSACGIEAPDCAIALVDPLDPGALLAHAGQCDAALSIMDGRLLLRPLRPAEFAAVPNAEDGAGRLLCDPEQVLSEADAPAWLTPETFHAVAALMRGASMAGAMQGALDLTLGYTQEREQFGRPLAKFQAIQHHLSDIACETAASTAAVEMANDALRADPHCGTTTLEQIAIAKIRCGEAASRVAAAAHQAHGAMGFTREYGLGRYTRRLWQWQDEFGSEREWAIRLGHAVLAETEPALWSRISAPI
ncbi:MAG: acyl-CoA dehydrogenase family protein [Erythrobacter sp.]